MAGISGMLNVAKEALLTHQLSVQVAAHNIANVDTPGYSRQVLGVTTNISTPSAVGNIGNGVQAVSIARKYDRFMTQRIMEQNSTLGDLEAQQQSLRVVEAIFNEAPGLALNDLMTQFWDSWQNLANNPEILSARQEVVQQGQLLGQHLQHMSAEIAKTKYDISMSLDNAVEDVNALTAQIADLNARISSTETTTYKANDLRDERDEILRELSSLIDVAYFENNSGDYTVLLRDGHSLVEQTQSWTLNWANEKMYWNNVKPDGTITRAPVSDKVSMGGKIGGYVAIHNELVEDNPENYLGKLDALANALVREVNQQHSQGAGLYAFSSEQIGTETAKNATHLNTTVNAANATDSIEAGIFKINDRSIGEIDGAAAVYGLAMTKASNAVQQINLAAAGVTAKMTTQLAGTVVDSTTLTAGGGDVFSFDINGVAVTYTTAAADVGDDALFAQNVIDSINTAITTYNATATNPMDISIEAVLGDDANGGVANSIVLRNTNAGDESRIIVGAITSTPVGLEDNLGLTAGTYDADATHNRGTISLFSDEQFTVVTNTDDTFLDHLGMGGGLTPEDRPNDGKFTYRFTDPGGVVMSLQGFQYNNELVTDGGSFDIWLYSSDGTLALPQPVNVSLERAYDLQDVADAINVSITNASGGGAWITASVKNNQLSLNPDSTHTFAFANDNSNFLQVAGINTFFSGYDASTLGVNSVVADNLNNMAAATVTVNGELFRGDNTNILAITNIQHDETVHFTGSTPNTLDDFYNSLVGKIGIRGRTVIRDTDFNGQVLNQMNEMRDSVSGVSLDEEMANLIRFQHAYSAAAKLISTADEMMITLLDTLKR
ncbi:MAG: flagellar hook-associated protein FlgK [Proteobacteria bacterium]|nr:flagellar hook-associated protein FlgK [Pseudomonadota bacterium]MBU1709407.1 flagellar hook-associated protein FlgK [Pseudomonadota bacterium]